MLEERRQRPLDRTDMVYGIVEAGTGEVSARKGVKTVVRGAQCGMLTGQHDGRPPADPIQGVGQWGKLDRFGPRADDQRNVCGAQPSP